MDNCDMENEMCLSNMPSGSNKLPSITKENVNYAATPSSSRGLESPERKLVYTKILSSISTPSRKLPKIIGNIKVTDF